MMVASSVLMERGVEVALQVTRRREPLVTGFTLIRFWTFRVSGRDAARYSRSSSASLHPHPRPSLTQSRSRGQRLWRHPGHGAIWRVQTGRVCLPGLGPHLAIAGPIHPVHCGGGGDGPGAHLVGAGVVYADRVAVQVPDLFAATILPGCDGNAMQCGLPGSLGGQLLPGSLSTSAQMDFLAVRLGLWSVWVISLTRRWKGSLTVVMRSSVRPRPARISFVWTDFQPRGGWGRYSL